MIDEVIKYDKDFSEKALFKYAEDIFNALINALMTSNITNLYPYLSENIYDKYQELIDGYKKMKIKRVFSDISFKNKIIQSSSANENEIKVKILMMTKYKDIFFHLNGEIVNEGTNNIIEKGHYITFTKDLTNPSSKYRITEMDVI